MRVPASAQLPPGEADRKLRLLVTFNGRETKESIALVSFVDSARALPAAGAPSAALLDDRFKPLLLSCWLVGVP